MRHTGAFQKLSHLLAVHTSQPLCLSFPLGPLSGPSQGFYLTPIIAKIITVAHKVRRDVASANVPGL